MGHDQNALNFYNNRAVTKISSCLVYAIRQWGIEQLGHSFGSIFFLFPMKVARGHAYSRDLTKLRQRRQWERQKTLYFMSKTTTLHVHNAFLYIFFAIPAQLQLEMTKFLVDLRVGTAR